MEAGPIGGEGNQVGEGEDWIRLLAEWAGAFHSLTVVARWAACAPRWGRAPGVLIHSLTVVARWG